MRRTTKTCSVNVVGFENDVALATEAMKFAVNYVREQNKRTEKRMKKLGYPTLMISSEKLGYGYGFVEGLKSAYTDNDQSEWGLVLQKPQDVDDFITDLNLTTKTMRSRAPMSNVAWGKGYSDGQNYKTPAGALA